jgi:hypothetical protein
MGTLRVLVQRVTSATQKPVAQHPFDLEYGVDTSGLIGGGDLGTGHAHDVYITAYAAVPPSRFDRTIRRSCRNVLDGDPKYSLTCRKGLFLNL